MPLALVVEDDNDVRLLFEAALSQDGFETLTAASAKEAIRLLGTHTPDIPDIDMNLPEFPGTHVLAYIRDTPRLSKTKKVVVTANDRTDSRAQEFDVDLFLIKPVMIGDMLKLAHRLIGTGGLGQFSWILILRNSVVSPNPPPPS